MASIIPKTMKAVLVEQHGGPDKLQYYDEHPTPSPGEGQLLIRNKMIGVNFIDTYFRTGLYPLPGKPSIIGQEAIGTVAALGTGPSSLGFSVGDRVVWLEFGSYAEYTSVPAQHTIRVPDGVSDQDAVGGFVMGTTALSLVQEAHPVRKGNWVLLHAAAGGVGLFMCQLLKATGAKTIATAGGAEKCELAKEYGADQVIDYKATGPSGWLDEVNRLTDGRGVDVVYDSVGKDTWEGSLEAVCRKGKVVFYGNSSGPVPPFPITKLTEKNVSVMRPTLMKYIYTRQEFEYYANQFFDLVATDRLKVRIYDTYRLEDVAQAHRDLEARKTTGKLLLKP